MLKEDVFWLMQVGLLNFHEISEKLSVLRIRENIEENMAPSRR